MGLAASQARFLALTARKADCEFRSMQLAQDKLSVTRELSEATDDYYNALNAETLVWDYDGTASNLQNLSYSLLTTPSAFNNYNPYLVTDKAGAVILSGSMAAAAEAAGIPSRDDNNWGEKGSYTADTGTSGGGGSFLEFMQALKKNDLIDQNTLNGVLNKSQASYYQYKNNDGTTLILTQDTAENILGKDSLKDYQKAKITIDGKEIEVATNLTDNQIEKIKEDLEINSLNKIGEEYSANIGYGDSQLNKDYVSGNNLVAFANKLSKLKDTDKNIFSTKCTDDKYTLTELGKAILGTSDEDYDIKEEQIYISKSQSTQTILTSLDISDLLYKQVTMNLGNDINSVTSKIETFINKLASNDTALYDMLIDGADSETKTAWKNAISATKNRFTTHIASGLENVQDASEYNALCKNGDNYCVSLTNILGCLLTQFELNLNGTVGSAYSILDDMSSSSLVTKNNDYLYPINNTEAVTDTDTLNTDFYMQMYNNLCINGWRKEEKITQDKFLENNLKNGNYFLTNIHDDGYFYQNRYTETDSVLVIKDEDAIAQAEAEFESIKTKLEYKEEKIDLEMKNLDAEISSVSTEYDSVKNLVNKNIEKIFAQFQ